MSKRLRFDNEASQELADAIDYHDGKTPGLGDELLEEVRHALTRVLSDPALHATAPGTDEAEGVQVAYVKRFSYQVFFIELEDEVRVVAVAHTSRRPLYWWGRLEGSDE